MEAMKGRIGRMSGSGLGNGVGLIGGVGAGVVCQSTDNSWYCTLTKITSAFMQILVVLFMIYFAWTVLLPFLGLKKRGGGRW